MCPPSPPSQPQWFTFPFLNLVFQFGDIKALLENRTVGATLYGASPFEKATVVLGKLVHYSLLWAIPIALHGGAAALSGAVAYMATHSIVLAATFAVSHNVPEAKPLDPGPTQDSLFQVGLYYIIHQQIYRRQEGLIASIRTWDPPRTHCSRFSCVV